MDKKQIEESLKFVNDFLNKEPDKRSNGLLDSKYFYYLTKAAKWYLRMEGLKNERFHTKTAARADW